MSAYLDWLRKQEHKVRRPSVAAATTTSSSSSRSATVAAPSVAFRAPSATLDDIDERVDLAELSGAYRAWRARREVRANTNTTTAATASTTRTRERPAAPTASSSSSTSTSSSSSSSIQTKKPRNSSAIVAAAVASYSLLAKEAAATDNTNNDNARPRPSRTAPATTAARKAPSTTAIRANVLPVTTTTINTPSLSSTAASKVAAAICSGNVGVRGSGPHTNSNSTRTGSLRVDTDVTHTRKRAIDDVDAPSQRSELPTKQQKVRATRSTPSRSTKRSLVVSSNSSFSSNTNSSNSDSDSVGAEPPRHKKKTPLDVALAKIDAEFGSHALLQAYQAGALASNDERDTAAPRLVEAQYWSTVDRFAELT